MDKGEIILYQPDNSIQLEVRMEEDTVWLNRQQMAVLFDRDVKTIGKHINNALSEELYGMSTIANFATVQKEGSRLVSREIEFFVRTSLPPVEGIFYDGQIFDAYTFAINLIKSAKIRIILIDNYIDESVLLMLSKRQDGVSALIVTRKITNTLKLDLARYQQQYSPIDVQEKQSYHDRFLIIDDTIYHLGASLKDLGKKLFAFSKMEMPVKSLHHDSNVRRRKKQL